MAESTAFVRFEGVVAGYGGGDVIRGVDFDVPQGGVTCIVGPNGSGKSSLLLALMGHPSYEVQGGSAMINGKDVLAMKPDERARKGLFLAFQYPREIEGVTTGNFMRLAYNAAAKDGKTLGPAEFIASAKKALNSTGLNDQFVGRFLNKGFSGGEKKRNEIAQMTVLKPKFALLDEVDSGLDIDALKVVISVIKKVQNECGTGIIMVTHNPRIVELVKPDVVHIMIGGEIVKSGGIELVKSVEELGFEAMAAKVSK